MSPRRVPSDELLGTMRAQGGMTFDETTQRHLDGGVMASRYGSEMRRPSPMSPDDLDSFRHTNRSQFAPDVHLGGWVNQSQDVVDLTHRFPDVASAKVFGEANMQEAVFDLTNFETHWSDFDRDRRIPRNSWAHAEFARSRSAQLRAGVEGGSGIVNAAMAEAWNEEGVVNPSTVREEDFDEEPPEW